MSTMSTSQVTKTIDLLGDANYSDLWINVDDATSTAAEIQEFVIDSILDAVGDATSPVEGGSWKRSLSPDYKDVKGKISSSTIANMELHGDMLDSLTGEFNGDAIEIGIFDSDQAAKAHGHNTGAGFLPNREFIPTEKQRFKGSIESGIREILESHQVVEEFEGDEIDILGGFTDEDFATVATTSSDSTIADLLFSFNQGPGVI